METTLYVGNFSQQVTEKELRGLFSRVGKVVSVDLIEDPKTRKSKGFAFVEMVDQGEAGKALSEYNGFNLGEHPLKVCVVQQNESLRERRNRANLIHRQRAVVK
jgi:RNA recognition motif-containing protein